MKRYIILLLLLAQVAYSYTVTPMVETFTATGKGKSQTFTIENSSNSPVSLELETMTRSIDKSGKEIRNETEDFIIYPMQLTVKPNSKRKVRVSYVGTPDLAKEKSYRLLVNQLSVKKNKNESGVKLVFSYVASLYVTNVKISGPKLEISKIIVKKGTLSFTLSNNGGTHAPLADFVLTLKDGSNERTLQDNDFIIRPLANYLSGTTTIAKLRLPKGFSNRSEVVITRR